jgi:septum formation protein
VRLVLGSGSVTRRTMLEQAGLTFEVVRPDVDEDAVKADWTDTPAALATELAWMKAMDVSARMPDATVIGGDQVLELDGWIFNKPGTRTKAARHLARLAGKTHDLHTAMAIARNSSVVHESLTTPRLSMFALSESEIGDYISTAPDSAWNTVGGYQVEGAGIRLFRDITGNWHDIMGLPLLNLMAWLRKESGK